MQFFILHFKLSPCSECCILSFWWCPGVWKPFGTLLKKGDSHLKHNSFISTVPWLPFLTPTQHRFSPHIRTTGLHLGGPCPPQPFSLLEHDPSPPLHLLIGSGYFQAKPFPLINTPTVLFRLFFLILAEGFPWYFLSCKANARVYDAKSRHGPHSPPQKRGFT